VGEARRDRRRIPALAAEIAAWALLDIERRMPAIY
jgi:hypothetical protein